VREGLLLYLLLSFSPHSHSCVAQVGQSKGLNQELAHLLKERQQLAKKYAQVNSAVKEREERSQQKVVLSAREHEEMELLKQVRKEIAMDGESLAKKATQNDEHAVKELVNSHFKMEKLAASRMQAQTEHAALEQMKKEKLAKRQLEIQELQAEARAEAKKELTAEGLIPAATKRVQHRAAQARAELHEKNVALANENQRLKDEARHMQEELRWAPRQHTQSAIGPGGETGIGDPLKKAGVLESSWGPLTSTAATRPDPRDSFAQDPHKRHYHYTGKAYTEDAGMKAAIARETLHLLPNLEAPKKAAQARAKAAKTTVKIYVLQSKK
jgi:hypothetical protein